MHPQPVPPVYAPELAARHIAAAVTSPKRQKVLGGFNHLLVLANKLAPGVIDHYVARTGVDSQQTDRPADPDAPADLWQPVDDREDHGARGIFGDQEGGMTPAWWLGVPALARDVALAAAARAGQVVRDRTAGGRT